MLKEKFVSNTGTHKDLKRHKGRSGPNFYFLYRQSLLRRFNSLPSPGPKDVTVGKLSPRFVQTTRPAFRVANGPRWHPTCLSHTRLLTVQMYPW